jgi:anti-anti-sigma factor
MIVKVLSEGEVSVISIGGRLEFERTKIFKEAMLRSLRGKKVIFKMDHLAFVGSAGIKNFFQFLLEQKMQNIMDVRIVGLKEEFFRLIEFSGLSQSIFCASFEEAMHSLLGLTTPETTGDVIHQEGEPIIPDSKPSDFGHH